MTTVPPTQCTIKLILVICSLPWLMTGKTMAHEVMHAWLHLHGFSNLPPPVEERAVPAHAFLWLEQQPAQQR